MAVVARVCGLGQGRALLGRSHGPVIAKTCPGIWMLAKSVEPSALKATPQNSLWFSSLRANG